MGSMFFPFDSDEHRTKILSLIAQHNRAPSLQGWEITDVREVAFKKAYTRGARVGTRALICNRQSDPNVYQVNTYIFFDQNDVHVFELDEATRKRFV